MTSISCRLATPWVIALGSGDEATFAPVTRHIESCLRCQASVARQRRLRRNLQELGDMSAVVPSGGSAESAAHRTSPGGRPLIIGAAGAVLAVGLGIFGIRRAVG